MGLPPGEAGPEPPGTPAAPPQTGDPRVDDVVARLNDLPSLPVADHPALFEFVHERLAETLGDLDAPGR
jgi:hypothetical protein